MLVIGTWVIIPDSHLAEPEFIELIFSPNPAIGQFQFLKQGISSTGTTTSSPLFQEYIAGSWVLNLLTKKQSGVPFKGTQIPFFPPFLTLQTEQLCYSWCYSVAFLIVI